MFENLADEFNYQNLGLLDVKQTISDLESISKLNEKISIYETPYWTYFLNVNDNRLPNIYGKFLLFKSFIPDEFIEKLKEGVKQGFSPIIKIATDKKASRSKVICIYTTDDKEELKKLANFLYSSGIAYEGKDINYKTEVQTRGNKYGKDFEAVMSLKDFILGGRYCN